MAAKDVYHDTVRRALEKDGWTITHDPLVLPAEGTELLVDLGAERLTLAERDGERIAVEVKSFLKNSPVQDVKESLGQYILYEQLLKESEEHHERTLYLAVRETVYQAVFVGGVGRVAVRSTYLRFVTFDEESEEIVRWIP